MLDIIGKMRQQYIHLTTIRCMMLAGRHCDGVLPPILRTFWEWFVTTDELVHEANALLCRSRRKEDCFGNVTSAFAL